MAGTFVHNQCIEHLWRDVFCTVLYFLLYISGHGGIRTASAKQQFAQVSTTLHFYPPVICRCMESSNKNRAPLVSISDVDKWGA